MVVDMVELGESIGEVGSIVLFMALGYWLGKKWRKEREEDKREESERLQNKK